MFRKSMIVVAVLAPAVALFLAVSLIQRPDRLGPVAEASSRLEAAPVPDETELNRLISTIGTRAAERDESLEYRLLGGLLLQRARLHASVADYRASYDAFTASVRLAPDHTAGLLGQGHAALGIHGFEAAGKAASRLESVDPGNLDGLALAGDAAYGAGSYEEARGWFVTIAQARPADPAAVVRLAQSALTEGDPGEAQRLAADAMSLAESQEFDPVTLAFYESFAGNLAFELGQYDLAADLLEAAVTHSPNDFGALGELSRLRAATGDLTDAIALLERANAIVAEPDHLVLLGDLRTLDGDRSGAKRDYERAVALATETPDHERAWARALATYFLDHEGDYARAGEIAAVELAARKDVGAWDLTAWAHYRLGDLRGARAAIDAAFAAGAPDATVLYHAGAISAALGQPDRAVAELSDALALNPGFDPLLARDARTLLEQLR